MLIRRLALGVAVWLAGVQFACAAGVKLGSKGWDIEIGSLGKLTMSYPKLGDKLAGPTGGTVNGKTGTLTYADGCTLTIEQPTEGVYQLHFQAIPDSDKKLRFEMPLPFALKGQASWIIDGKSGTFAEQYGGKPMLFQGDAKRLTLKDSAGKGFAIIMPFGFQQLQDNREWKSNEFQWFSASDMPGAGEAWMQIKIADTPDGNPEIKAAAQAAPAAEPVPVAPVANAKPTFALSDKELVIRAGTAGRFGMSLPTLVGVTGGVPNDIVLSADRKTLSYKYPAGGSAKLTLADDGSVTVSFSELPATASKVRMETMIPLTFNNGGKFSISGGGLQAFPKDKPASPMLYQGNADSISVLHASGAGFAVSGFEMGTFHQIQDNREWNWGIFVWWFESPLPAGNSQPSFTLRIASPVGGSATVKPLIDRFGQHAEAKFDGKVTSEAELKADMQADKEYFASLKPPVLDRFGGLPGSQQKYGFKKTGFFHIEKADKTQVLVDPDGNAFFQLGLCALGTNCDDYTTVRGRESIYEWLPSKQIPAENTAWRPNDPGVMSFYIANLVRKFGRPFNAGEFVQMWIDRTRKWGYNSAGAFAGWDAAGTRAIQDSSLPYVTFLPLGGVAAELPVKGVWDPFGDGIEDKMDAAFARGLAASAKDPLIIGYFITNEPSIEDVPKAISGLKGSTYAAKRRLVQMFQEKYQNIAAFNAAWETKAQSFDDLKDMALIVGSKGAAADMEQYFALFLEQRYSLINKYFRKHDPNHLLIGDRLMPGTANSEALVRTSGKYLDVISVNYYTYGLEKAFMDRIHDWSGGKPMLLSEFYFACRDQGLMGGTQVVDQKERGLAYRNYVEQAAATGYVVGIQWFSFIDQAATGRFFEGFNGEAANIGLVNVADRPYKAFLAEAMQSNYHIYDVLLGGQKAYAFDDPRFTKKQGGKKVVSVYRMRQAVTLDGRREEWPPVPPTRIGGDRLVHGENAKDFEATYRLAWDDRNLYLFIEVTDTTPMHNDLNDADIWAADSIELFAGVDNLDQGGSLQFGDRQVLVRGAKSDATHAPAYFANAPRSGYTAQTAVVPNTDGKGYTVEAAIPFEALGFVPKVGQAILFDISVNDGDGGRRTLAWNGTFQNSKDRGGWGRAEFTN